jgi:RHH-type proline utilization regulon transcriptional repressor/proline dehydrogenase/delta 1-pyrroline-5-carboxylate dehydrogenase
VGSQAIHPRIPAPHSGTPTQEQVLAVAQRIEAAMPRRRRALGERLDDELIRVCARDEHLRTALFRFIDVRPACRTRRELGEHLTALLGEAAPASGAGRVAASLARASLTRSATALAAGVGVQRVARRFIVGTTVPGSLASLERLWRSGEASSLDLLGEESVSEGEADRYAALCIEALQALGYAVRHWPARGVLEEDSLGRLPRANLSVKVTALTPAIRADAPRRGIQDALERLRSILRCARELEAHVHVDMESLDSRETVLGLVLELLSEPEFAAGPSAGLVLQAYLRDSPEELEQILAWVARTRRSSPLTVRLVKGAYWDHEVVEARQHGWEVPVFEQRAQCDRNFEALTRRLLEAAPRVRVALGSHNLRSIAHGIACMPLAGLPERDVELQVLRGLGDDIGEALARAGLRVRVYCPVGDLVEGMAYLVRRMLENTANDSFLQARARGADLERLLAQP